MTTCHGQIHQERLSSPWSPITGDSRLPQSTTVSFKLIDDTIKYLQSVSVHFSAPATTSSEEGATILMVTILMVTRLLQSAYENITMIDEAHTNAVAYCLPAQTQSNPKCEKCVAAEEERLYDWGDYNTFHGLIGHLSAYEVATHHWQEVEYNVNFICLYYECKLVDLAIPISDYRDLHGKFSLPSLAFSSYSINKIVCPDLAQLSLILHMYILFYESRVCFLGLTLEWQLKPLFRKPSGWA